MSAKISQAKCHTVNGVNLIVAAVARLLPSRCPSAVPRFIVASVIRESVNRHPFRHFAHVFQKLSKRLFPLIANGDTTTAVVFKTTRVWICCSLKNSLPNCKSSRLSAFSCVSMLLSRARNFLMQTTARLTVARYKRQVEHGFYPTALALAKACGLNSPKWAIGQHRPSDKCLTNDGYSSRTSSRHSIGSFNVLFSGGRPATTGAHCDSLGLTPFAQ